MRRLPTACLPLILGGCHPGGQSLDDTGPIAFDVLRIEEIEGNAHAVWVSVGVSEPARVRLEFSQLGESSLATPWQEEALRHRIPLVGLLGGSESEVVAHAQSERGEWVSEPLSFTTLDPLEFLQPTASGALAEEGLNGLMYLMDQTDRRTAEGADGPMRFVGVDQLGRLIWDHRTEEGVVGHAPFVEVFGDGTFFYRTATGGVQVTAVGEEVSNFDLGEALHHDAERLPNGNWVVMTQTYDTIESEDIGEFILIGDALVEVDPSGAEVWRWEVRDHLDWESTQTELNEPIAGLQVSDWTHANSIQYLVELDSFLLGLRNLSQIILISRQSGEILWTLGEGGDFELASGTWFSGQHDAQMVGSHEMILYDNALNGVLSESRGLRLRLDVQDMNVEILEEFSAGVAAYTMGSISLLEDGGVVLSSGGHRTDGVPSRVLQYSPDGEEVLRLEQVLMKQLNYRTTVYPYATPL